MTLQIDKIRGHGGLVRISPGDETYLGHTFYRLFGGNSTLDYIMGLIENPQETRSLNYIGIYKSFTSNLDQVIESLSKTHVTEQSYYIGSQIRETLTNYFHQIKQDTEIPEIRRRLQSYKTILENINNGVELSKIEQKEQKELLDILKFFSSLEESYRNSARFKDALDIEKSDYANPP